MINILFISSSLEKNGTEEFMMNVLRGLDRKSYHADFLIFSEGETENSKEAQSYGATIYRLPQRRKGLIYYRTLLRFFRNHKGKYNAVHWNEGEMTTLAPIFFAWKYKVPVRIIHAHNSNTNGLFRQIQHWFNKNFNLKYCTHRFACSSLASDFFFNNTNSIVIKNGIMLKKFAYNEEWRKAIRFKLKISNETLVIGHVGRFTDVKNQSFLVDVFKEVQKIEEDSKLIFIGIGEQYETIHQKVRNFELQDNVIFAGQQNNVNEWMQSFDIFVMPSLYEGLPFVLVEAQAAGLPCVVSDSVNKDACILDTFCFKSMNDSPSDWADLILEKCHNNHDRNTVNVLERAGFSIDSTVKYLEKVYSNQ